jgi:hypothetical protein
MITAILVIAARLLQPVTRGWQLARAAIHFRYPGVQARHIVGPCWLPVCCLTDLHADPAVQAYLQAYKHRA